MVYGRTVYLRRYFRGIQLAQPARWQFGRSAVLVARRPDVNANTNAFKLAALSFRLSARASRISPPPSLSLSLSVPFIAEHIARP